jgi:RNA polymerase sigma-70 factor (ECF subfamily)
MYVPIEGDPTPPTGPAPEPLAHLVARGRARVPEARAGEAELAPLIGERSLREVADLADDRLGELYLALACAAGDPGALRALERDYLAQIQRTVSARARDTGRADDVMQRLRLAVLVGQDGRWPAIASFGGAGPLSGWLRIAALRILLRLERREQRWIPVEPEQLTELQAIGDPELAAMRERYGDGVQQALADAYHTLPARDRVLLRLRYTDGCGIDRIARVERIHRATAARRLRRAEDELVRTARRLLCERTGASEHDLDSVLRLLRSQIALSARAVFAA